jgi:hypothetical protein
LVLDWQGVEQLSGQNNRFFKETLMSLAPVSASLNAAPMPQQQFFQTRSADLLQLGKDLGTGDVAGAKAEYQDIVSLGKSGPFASGNAFANPEREQDFTNIGQALQSGNLAGALQSFSALKSTFGKHVTDPLMPAPPVIDHPMPVMGGSNGFAGFGGTEINPILSAANGGTVADPILTAASGTVVDPILTAVNGGSGADPILSSASGGTGAPNINLAPSEAIYASNLAATLPSSIFSITA